MVCAESVAHSAFRVTVIFGETCTHVYSGMVMAAVRLAYRLNLAARYATEYTAGHRVTQSDILREYGVKSIYER